MFSVIHLNEYRRRFPEEDTSVSSEVLELVALLSWLSGIFCVTILNQIIARYLHLDLDYRSISPKKNASLFVSK